MHHYTCTLYWSQAIFLFNNYLNRLIVFYLHWRHSQGGYSSQSFEQMSQDIDNRNVDNSFELPQELVSYHGSKHGAEVAEHGEGVVDGGAFVMVKMELLVDVNAEDRFHAIV